MNITQVCLKASRVNPTQTGGEGGIPNTNMKGLWFVTFEIFQLEGMAQIHAYFLIEHISRDSLHLRLFKNNLKYLYVSLR